MAGSSKKGAAWSWRRLALGAACVAGLADGGLRGLSVLAARHGEVGRAGQAGRLAVAPPAATSPSDYGKRPVAFLNGNEAITREQLGEYLIARYGADKLPLLVNKLIIEEACHAKGIDVTPAEVEASFAEDVASMGGGITQKMFVDNILKQYKKTLFEWKEDVVRPKLLMSKLVRDRVKVTEEEIQAGYEAYYGEKIDCKVIYWPRGEKESRRSSTPPSGTATRNSTARPRCRPTAGWRPPPAIWTSPSAVTPPATTKWSARRSSCNRARSAP